MIYKARTHPMRVLRMQFDFQWTQKLTLWNQIKLDVPWKRINKLK